MMNLTLTDVKKLANEPSAEVRGLLATKIAMDYRCGHFTAAESAIANDIFRLVLKDVEKKMRESLAEQLAHAPQAPHDIIVQLANDDFEVAEHVLHYSMVLTDDDLIAIVNSTKEITRLRAIARRDHLTSELCGHLIDTRHESVLQDLFSNRGADIDEGDLIGAWDSVSTHESLMEALVHRGNLSVTVAEKLFFAVSDELKSQLASRYRLNTPVIYKAVTDVREWELLGISPSQSGSDPRDDGAIEELIDQMHATGRLTYSLIMRALCLGNLSIFETGLAKLAGVPRVNARILLMDNGGHGFDAIYKAADMPEGFLDAVKTLLRLSFEETEYGRVRRPDFRKRIIERIYMGRYHLTVENMEYLLSIIGGKIAATASVH